MTERELTRLSKFLSLVLRHKPEVIGITLDENGWVEVDELIRKAQRKNKPVTHEVLQQVVVNNNKQRFAFSEDGRRIRANQGHSVKINLGYEPTVPPAILFHGTGRKYVDSILQSGLVKKARHHVHLSSDEATALTVGRRHGKPFIFQVLAGQMHADGHHFYVSDNGVWLTEAVPVQYLVGE